MGSTYNKSNVNFSNKKYYSFRNKIFTKFSERFHADMQIKFIANALLEGDTQPAVVLTKSPLVIAAYSDEMDAVVLLKFPDMFADKYNLSEGTRLTTANIYFRSVEGTIADDIFVGKNFTKHYTDFVPIVQLFLGKSDEKIIAKTGCFDSYTWDRVIEKANNYLTEHPDAVCRDGFYYFKK